MVSYDEPPRLETILPFVNCIYRQLRNKKMFRVTKTSFPADSHRVLFLKVCF